MDPSDIAFFAVVETLHRVTGCAHESVSEEMPLHKLFESSDYDEMLKSVVPELGISPIDDTEQELLVGDLVQKYRQSWEVFKIVQGLIAYSLPIHPSLIGTKTSLRKLLLPEKEESELEFIGDLVYEHFRLDISLTSDLTVGDIVRAIIGAEIEPGDPPTEKPFS